MAYTVEFADEDYPGISQTCKQTSIQTVFTDNDKKEIIIIADGKAIIIKL